MRIRTSMAVVLATLCTLCAAIPAGAAHRSHTKAPARAAASTLTAAEQALATAVNSARAANGLPALTIDARLESAARDHAQDLLTNNAFTHDFLKGGTAYPFGTWIRWYYNGCSAGENLAWGRPSLSPAAAVQMWLNSPGHRANLLSRSFTTMGVALQSANGEVMAANDFGRPC
jgi:uncharacterized protein YkwD